jgi:hypothetical protein
VFLRPYSAEPSLPLYISHLAKGASHIYHFESAGEPSLQGMIFQGLFLLLR